MGERGKMQVQILGPLQVVHDGHEVDIGAASQRRLLARLAVASPEAVPAERLAEDLEVSPGGLRTAVSRLRKTAGDTVVTQPPGYKLTAALDRAPFETQLAQALQAVELEQHHKPESRTKTRREERENGKRGGGRRSGNVSEEQNTGLKM